MSIISSSVHVLLLSSFAPPCFSAYTSPPRFHASAFPGRRDSLAVSPAIAIRHRAAFEPLSATWCGGVTAMQTTSAGDGDDGARAEIEVEQKFALPPDGDASCVHSRLYALGFVPKAEAVKFTDWYFDLPAPHWSLTPRDTWLRYRGRKIGDEGVFRGVWQLKVGRQNGDNSASTTYEEIEGGDALDIALSMLPLVGKGEYLDSSSDDTYDGMEVPEGVPTGSGLVPFARFETTRSSWVLSERYAADSGSPSPFIGLTVDLDGTDFGYMVGEVEAIVYNEDNIADARKRTGRLVSEIVGSRSNPSVPTLGKLETYMIEHRREQYDVCVKAGSMRSRS